MDKETVRKLMGANIRNARIARNMTTEELAKLLSLSPGFIGLIESGRRGATLYNLQRLAHVFDMPLSAFFPNDNEAKENPEMSAIQARRAKLFSLVSDLDTTEMEHVIGMVKEIRDLLSYKKDKEK